MDKKDALKTGYLLEKARKKELSLDEKLNLAKIVKELSDIGYRFDENELSEIFGMKLTYRKGK